MTSETLALSKTELRVSAIRRILIAFGLTFLALILMTPDFSGEVSAKWVLVGVFYFLPAVMAYTYDKKNQTAIFLLNLLLGWTGLGWVIALVWSAVKD